MGSHVHIAEQALALAMELERVLVWLPDHEQFPFRDESRCPNDFTWDCWWQPITRCPLPGPGADVLVKEVIDDLNVNMTMPLVIPTFHCFQCTQMKLLLKQTFLPFSGVAAVRLQRY